MENTENIKVMEQSRINSINPIAAVDKIEKSYNRQILKEINSNEMDHKSTKSNINNNTTTIDDETINPADKEFKLNENNLKGNYIQKCPTKLPDILNSVQTVDNNNVDDNDACNNKPINTSFNIDSLCNLTNKLSIKSSNYDEEIITTTTTSPSSPPTKTIDVLNKLAIPNINNIDPNYSQSSDDEVYVESLTSFNENSVQFLDRGSREKLTTIDTTTTTTTTKYNNTTNNNNNNISLNVSINDDYQSTSTTPTKLNDTISFHNNTTPSTINNNVNIYNSSVCNTNINNNLTTITTDAAELNDLSQQLYVTATVNNDVDDVDVTIINDKNVNELIEATLTNTIIDDTVEVSTISSNLQSHCIPLNIENNNAELTNVDNVKEDTLKINDNKIIIAEEIIENCLNETINLNEHDKKNESFLVSTNNSPKTTATTTNNNNNNIVIIETVENHNETIVLENINDNVKDKTETNNNEKIIIEKTVTEIVNENTESIVIEQINDNNSPKLNTNDTVIVEQCDEILNDIIESNGNEQSQINDNISFSKHNESVIVEKNDDKNIVESTECNVIERSNSPKSDLNETVTIEEMHDNANEKIVSNVIEQSQINDNIDTPKLDPNETVIIEKSDFKNINQNTESNVIEYCNPPKSHPKQTVTIVETHDNVSEKIESNVIEQSQINDNIDSPKLDPNETVIIEKSDFKNINENTESNISEYCNPPKSDPNQTVTITEIHDYVNEKIESNVIVQSEVNDTIDSPKRDPNETVIIEKSDFKNINENTESNVIEHSNSPKSDPNETVTIEEFHDNINEKIESNIIEPSQIYDNIDSPKLDPNETVIIEKSDFKNINENTESNVSEYCNSPKSDPNATVIIEKSEPYVIKQSQLNSDISAAKSNTDETVAFIEKLNDNFNDSKIINRTTGYNILNEYKNTKTATTTDATIHTSFTIDSSASDKSNIHTNRNIDETYVETNDNRILTDKNKDILSMPSNSPLTPSVGAAATTLSDSSKKRLSIRSDLFNNSNNSDNSFSFDTTKNLLSPIKFLTNNKDDGSGGAAAVGGDGGIFIPNFSNQLDVTFKKPNAPAPLAASSLAKLQQTSFTTNITRKKNNELNSNMMMMMIDDGRTASNFSGCGDGVGGDEEEFSSNGMIYNPSDFDLFLSKNSNTKNNNYLLGRSSLLLNFDPLLGGGQPHQHLQQQQQQQQHPQLLQQNLNLQCTKLTSTSEEETESLQKQYKQVDQNRNVNIDQNNNNNNNDNDNNNQESLSDTLPLPEINNYQQSSGDNSADEGAVSLLVTVNNSNINNNSNNNNNNIHNNNKDNNSVHPNVAEGDVTMSVDIIKDMKMENDLKSFENHNLERDEKKDFKMAELEKKIKNEVLKTTEDYEKKIKEYEGREEALLKRITEKDKTLVKMTSVLEAYEKAIAEMVAEKEQLTQNDDQKITELKKDRDLNFQHLMSLEATFADLHVKYERSKQITMQLKESEEQLIEEKKQLLQQLKAQEQRYDQMKSHAVQQLDYANSTLETLTKTHSIDLTKLKAQLKKEEISKQSISEQLLQKSKENEELVKICDELITGQGS